MLRNSVGSWLREAGYEIHEAATGREGLALIAAKAPELAILELELPELSGLEICRRLKAGPHGNIPLILFSDRFTSSARRAECLSAGATACLAEPVQASELLAQVESLLRAPRVEVALRLSEERFRLATEALDGVVYEWDVWAGVARRSAGIAEFLGWRPEEAADSKWWPEQIHPDDLERVERHFAEAVASRAAACRHEYRIRHKNGHYRWIWDSNRIVYGEDGKPVRVIGCALSIDAQKRAEQDLREAKEQLALANTDLERKVEERTSKLVEMVGELESWSYSIAHDMRAPLRAIHSFGYFLLEEYGPKLDAAGRDYLERMDAATRRLDDYIGDLLNYGKIGRGDFPLATVDTTRLIGEILATYPNLQPSACHIEVQAPLPPVTANASALTQVFSNLLGNAVKFVTPGTLPRVKIWAEQRDPWVRLWFEDNGIGIDEKAQARLFGIFQRLHPASDYEGTGIGLAIVRRAVERMGGAVGVGSEPGKGSRFWVELKSAKSLLQPSVS